MTGAIRITTRNAGETQRLAGAFSGRLKAGDVICLDGELGAGKTVFTKGIAVGLGIEEMISSPTFMLVMEHENPGGLSLFHFDAYRLGGADDFFDSGLEEYFYGGGVCVVEWGMMIADVFRHFPDSRVLYIHITSVSETEREFLFSCSPEREEEMRFFVEEWGIVREKWDRRGNYADTGL